MSTSSPDPAPDISPFEAFRAARGVPEDGWWAMEALAAIVASVEAKPTLIFGALDRARERVATEGRSPDDLFGSPVDFATETVTHWQESRVDYLEKTPATPGELVGAWLIWAAVISVFRYGMFLFEEAATVSCTIGLVAFPLLVPMTIGLAFTTRRRVLRRKRPWVGSLAAVGVALAGTAALIGLIVLGEPHPLWTGSPLWTLALAGAYGTSGLAVLAILPPGHDDVPAPSGVTENWHVPESPRREVGGAAPEGEAWLREVAYLLLTKHSVPVSRVYLALDDAIYHLEHEGPDLTREFGPPATFAASAVTAMETPARLRTWPSVVPVVVVLALVLGMLAANGWRPTPPWWLLVAWLLFALLRLVATLRRRRLRRDA